MPVAISTRSVQIHLSSEPGDAFSNARQIVRARAGLRPTFLDEQDGWLTSPAAHPFYRHAEVRFLLARRANELLGRAAIIIDREHNSSWKCSDALLAFFESVDDTEVAGQLLKAGHEWAVRNGMTRVLGTVNPSANYSCGIQIGGFQHAPVTMLDDNPPYYARLLREHGYASEMSWLGYQFPRESAVRNSAKFTSFAERSNHARIEFSPLAADRMDIWRPMVHALYNDSFKDEWGFVPMGDDEFALYLQRLAPHWYDQCSILATCGGDPAGFVCTASTPASGGGDELPLHVLFLCVAQRYRMRGVAMGLIASFVRAFAQCSSANAEFHSNENHEFMQKIAAALDATVCRQYALFIKDLTVS